MLKCHRWWNILPRRLYTNDRCCFLYLRWCTGCHQLCGLIKSTSGVLLWAQLQKQCLTNIRLYRTVLISVLSEIKNKHTNGLRQAVSGTRRYICVHVLVLAKTLSWTVHSFLSLVILHYSLLLCFVFINCAQNVMFHGPNNHGLFSQIKHGFRPGRFVRLKVFFNNLSAGAPVTMKKFVGW